MATGSKWSSGIHALVVVLLVELHTGMSLHMLSKGSIFVLNAGDDVELDCEFSTDQFNLFDNPIQWTKNQHMENIQVNMMGNLLDPFASTRRFDVSFNNTAPKYSLPLTITDVTMEDNGNYTCEVSGPENKLLGFTTHALVVTAPVDGIIITNKNASRISSSSSFNNSSKYSEAQRRSLIYTETESGTLRCIAHGGYPPPDVNIYFGHRDVTDEFRLTRTAQLTGTSGLQVIQYITERWSFNFRFGAEDDGKKIKCVVSTQGVASNTSSVRVIVHYAPQIDCDPASAVPGDKNVFVRCEIKCRPKPSAIYWIIDGNGTTVTEEETTTDFWTLTTEMNEGVIETRLFLRSINEDSFRTYILAAENSVAARRYEVPLIHKSRLPTSKYSVSVPKSLGIQSNKVSGRSDNVRHRNISPSQRIDLTIFSTLALITTLTNVVFN